MAWSFERIKPEWVGDALVAHSPAELVRLFDLVEAVFGEEWVKPYGGNHILGRGGPPVGAGDPPKIILSYPGRFAASRESSKMISNT